MVETDPKKGQDKEQRRTPGLGRVPLGQRKQLRGFDQMGSPPLCPASLCRRGRLLPPILLAVEHGFRGYVKTMSFPQPPHKELF